MSRPALERFNALTPAQRAQILAQMPAEDRADLIAFMEQLAHLRATTLINQMFPDTGPFARHLYKKQMELYELGATHQFRALLGGNGTGKTQSAAIELVYHLTGDYPHWWRGWRFNRPIRAICAGDTIPTVRDIIQVKLLGEEDQHGTGLIPAKAIQKIVLRQNGNGAIDWMRIRHKSGGASRVYFKSYDQGRKTFQGTNMDFIWLDEECPMDIYVECVHRFRGASVDGRLLLTFTPLNGVTDVVKLFVPQFASEDAPVDSHTASRTFVLCSWDDIPHLSDEEKERKLSNTLPYEREARIRGIPTVGRGRVFTVEEDAFVVSPFPIPPSWPRIYGADFGFGNESAGAGTGAIWGAWDQTTDTCYLYEEYFRAEAPPSVHAAAIKARGDWIPGVGDYAGKDLEGNKTLDIYRDLGLDIINADKSVYGGLQIMTQMFNEGRLRVFSTCQKWLQEYRLYSFDEKNQVIKKRDHLLDASRYLVMADRRRAKTKPIPKGMKNVKPETFGLY